MAAERLCRRRGWGLLVTAHATVGLPQLYQTTPTPDLAEMIVGRLMTDRTPPFAAVEVTECFRAAPWNLRETLFDLYDLYERRR